MNRRRRDGAGRAPGVASRMAAAALAVACALVLAGCVSPVPKPAPDCSDPIDAGDAAQQELQDRLDDYGLWSPTWADPPSAAQLQHPAPVPPGFDPRRKVWGTSIQLAPGVNGRVSIVTPQDARLFVSPNWDRMGSLTALELQLGARRSVHLIGCDGVAFYPALTIVDGPECVVYAVQRDDDDRIAQIYVPFFGAEC